MADRTGTIAAALAGTIDIGGDLAVNRFGFGAMRITGEGIWGEPADREECKRVLRRALELGINFIDTADSYGPGVSERLIAETLYPYPEELVIATKGGLIRPGPGQWIPDGRPEHLRAASAGAVAETARRNHATPTQVVLAWLLAHSPVMLPIPGTSKVAHLEENLGAVALDLAPAELAELDTIAPEG